MASIGSFSGLASGVQWRDLIDQIIAAQSTPITRLQNQQKQIEAQKTAWASFRTKVSALETAAKGLADATRLRGLVTTVQNLSGGTAAALRATASTSAEPGSYRVDVLSLASAEKLGGKSFASRSDALAMGGTVLVNGRALTLDPADSLDKVAARFNELNTGTTPSGVSAAVVATTQGGYRLVLTSATRGAAGMDLRDTGGSVLRGLGLVDTTTELRSALPNGAFSASFGSAETSIGQQLGLSAAPSTLGPGTGLRIGGVAVEIDLAVDSLNAIRDRINAVRADAARIVPTTANGNTTYRLEVTGSTTFTDESGVLETLGIVAGARTSQAQTLTSDPLTLSGGGAVDASTTLSALQNGPAGGGKLRLSGTRADGSAFTLELAADLTLGDVVTKLNEAAAFGADAANPLRPAATVKLDGGALTVTDDATGESSLSLSAVSIDADGTTRELTAFSTTEGRTRVLAAGSDALIKVDGAYLARATNEITDAIPGLTFNLAATGTVNVDVARDVNSATGAITGFVTAYNDLADFVTSQLTPAAAGASPPPLYGQSTLRSMQASLKTTLQATVTGGIAGTLTRMADIGVEIDRYGKFTVDQAKLSEAVKNRPADVERFFGVSTSSGSSRLSYLSSSSATKSGTYTVTATPATRATKTGATSYIGLGDTLHVTDIRTGSTYSVTLADGATDAAIAAALQAEFDTAQARQLSTAGQLGTAGTLALDTLLTDLTVDGAAGGILAADSLAIEGTRSDGTTFTTSFAVSDAAYTGGTASTGDLIAAIQQQYGTDATVALVDGHITVTGSATGTSKLALRITNGGTAVFGDGGGDGDGDLGVTAAGRTTASITAARTGTGLVLTHGAYGADDGFTVTYQSGDASDPLGLAGTTRGTNITGTINGDAATGTATTLKGDAGTAAEGLLLSLTGTDPLLDASFTFSRGIGALAEAAAKALTQANTGALDALTQRLDERIQQLGDRADTLEQRLESRREQLVRQFTAMEQAMSMAQQQSAWLTSQMAAFENKKQ